MSRRQLSESRSRCLAIVTILPMLPIACAVWPGAGSSTASTAVKPNASTEALVSPTELRIRVQRFADGLSEALAQPLDQLLANEPDIRKRKSILEAKYAYTSNALFIASGPYPTISLLDMVVFVNLLRATIDRDGHKLVGDAVGPLLRVAEQHEREVWRLSSVVLTAPQREDLREMIDAWLVKNADRGYAEAVRFGEFASQLDSKEGEKARGLMSQIRQATATADQALELAERMTYFLQRAPAIWRLHGQLGFFEVMSQPEATSLLANSDRIAASTEQLSNTVSELSSLITSGPSPEQEVFFSHLDTTQKSLVELMGEARGTMAAANELATTMEVLATRFDVGAPKPEGSKPFDIALYEGAALQMASTAGEFRHMIETLDGLLSSSLVADQLPHVAAAAEAEGERVVRRTVWIIAGGTVAAFCAMLAALLVYRILVARLISPPSAPTT